MQLVFSPQDFFLWEIKKHHLEHKMTFTKLSCNAPPFPSKCYDCHHVLKQPCFHVNSAMHIIFPVSQTLHHTVSKPSHSLGTSEGWSSVQVQACPIDLLLLKNSSSVFLLGIPFLAHSRFWKVTILKTCKTPFILK